MKITFNVTIPNGEDTSGEVSYQLLRNLRGLSIIPPGSLTGDVTIEVSGKKSGSGDWSTLQSGGVDIAVDAEKATVIAPVPFMRMRLVSSGNEASDRLFEFVGDEG